jgi:hypothetical protein
MGNRLGEEVEAVKGGEGGLWLIGYLGKGRRELEART